MGEEQVRRLERGCRNAGVEDEGREEVHEGRRARKLAGGGTGEGGRWAAVGPEI